MKVQIPKEMMNVDCLMKIFPKGGITIYPSNIIEYNAPKEYEEKQIKFKKVTIDHKNQIETIGHVTVAYYYDALGIYIGFAFCVETDTFNQNLGRMIALYRLINNINEDFIALEDGISKDEVIKLIKNACMEAAKKFKPQWFNGTTVEQLH